MIRGAIVAGCAACLLLRPEPAPAADPPAAARAAMATSQPIVPLPPSMPVDPARSALGARLFSDPLLSADRRRACSSCHPLDRAGVDGQRRAIPSRGPVLLRNTPTVFNLAFDLFYNWDGATESLAAHDAKVLRSSALMGIDDAELLARLRRDTRYREDFARAYPDGVTYASVLDAIATFERSLVTPDSRFDRWLRGEHDAISAQEQHGYELFRSLGCIACHQGRNVGGNLLQKFGVFEDTATGRAPGEPVDEGRWNVTHDALDHQVFRVPSLRNVAVTGPWFHDGRAATLSMAVATMARVQLGRDVPEKDIADLVAFLGTLTGNYQGRELRAMR